MNGYDATVKGTGIKLDAKEKKQITAAVSWKNPEAEKVVKKVHKKGVADPVYGERVPGIRTIPLANLSIVPQSC